MAYVQTSQGVFVVDDADLPLVSSRRWYLVLKHSTWYVRCTKTKEYLHRILSEAPDGVYVDHVNGDGRDNRRSNLRLCAHHQNLRNTGKHKDNSAGFKGVSRTSSGSRFRARIRSGGRDILIGHFCTAEEAAEAYRQAAERLHGEYARTEDFSGR